MSRPYDVVKDQGGIPVPQIETDAGTDTMPWKGKDNAGYVDIQEPIERVTQALKQIGTDHAYIHEGIGYKTHLELGTLTATKTFSMEMPVDQYLHFKNLRLMAQDGGCKVSIIKDAVVASAGATITAGLTGPHNLNDVVTAVSSVTIRQDPTYSGGETWDFAQVLGDSTNQFKADGETKGFPEEELVMRPSTTAAETYYLLEAAKVGSDNPENVTISMFWYEEDGA